MWIILIAMKKILNQKTKIHNEINLKISEEIESRGHQDLGTLSAGEKKEIEIGLRADKVGELPVNISLNYTNPITNEQLASQIALWLNIEPVEEGSA